MILDAVFQEANQTLNANFGILTRGEKGADGTVAFEELTEEQKASLKGDKGDKGDRGERGEKGDKGEKGDSVANGEVEAKANTIPIRDASASVNVNLKFADICDGYPTPIKKEYKSELNIISWDETVAESFSSNAQGTENDPIIISTAEEFALMLKLDAAQTVDKFFKFADGIDAIVLQSGDKAKEIIALDSAKSTAAYFKNQTSGLYEWVCKAEKSAFCGTFDGNGVIIYGGYMNSTECAFSGIFGTLGVNAVIKNLAFKNCYLRSHWLAGVIASDIVGYTVDDNTVTDGTVKIENCVVKNCYITAHNSVTNPPNNCFGIMIGGYRSSSCLAKVAINNCFVSDNRIWYEKNGSDDFSESIYNYLTGRIGNISLKNSLLLDLYGMVLNTPTSRLLENIYVTDTTKDISDDGYIIIDKQNLQDEKAFNYVSKIDMNMWVTPYDYTGKSVPINYVSQVADFLSGYISNSVKKLSNDLTDITNEITKEKISRQNAISNESTTRAKQDENLSTRISANRTNIARKAITSRYVSGDYTFDYNAMYFLVSNTGKTDITICDSDGNVLKDGDGNDLPDAQFCALILPENALTSGEGRLCYYVGITGKLSLTNLNAIKGLQFFVPTDEKVTCNCQATCYKIAF